MAATGAWAAAALVLVAALAMAGSGPATAGPAASAPGPVAWGVGWSSLPWSGVSYAGGLTARLGLGRWQLGLAGSPYTSTFDETNAVRGLEEGGAYVYSEPRQRETRDSWLRLEVGRELWRHGRLGLSLVGTASAAWDRYEWVELDVNPATDPMGISSRSNRTSQDTWGLGLGLRPSYALLDHFSVDFDLGFGLTGWDAEGESWQIQHGQPQWDHTRSSSHGTTFETVGGWQGMGSLNLIYWF